MATHSTTIKQFIVTATANADFRAIIAVWRAAFTAWGWVQTADTGQINPSTVNFPGSNNTTAGTEVWRFDDSLQSTTPVYIKISYGRGADANDWRVAFQISLGGTDGAQNFITAVTSDALIVTFAQAGTRTNADATAYRVDSSGDTGRGVISFFHNVVSTPRGGFFSIERTKNSDGTDNADGVVAYFMKHFAGSASTSAAVFLDPLATYSPAWNNFNAGVMVSYLAGVGGSTNPLTFGSTVRANNDTTSTLYKGKVYVFPLFPYHPGWKYPLMNILQYAVADFPNDFSAVTIPYYGSNHTYLPLGTQSSIMQGFAIEDTTFMIRYE